MEVISNNFLPGDPRLVQQLVNELKSQGIFDQFRKECFADVDTKPAYQNLRQRVEGSVAAFLKEQTWSPDMNKNQVREQLKKNIYESGYLETGVERIVDQVVNPKINTVFLPIVEDVVYKYLGIEKRHDPQNKVTTNVTDLLPKDLEAISPESVQSLKHDDQKNDTDTLNESVTSKMDEDESPPFEPLEGVQQTATTLQEETSMDSELSGISGLQSHESNLVSESKSSQMDWSWQDAQLSQNSSESKLSVVTSEEQKTEMTRDFAFLKNTDSDSKGGTNTKIEDDTTKTDDSVESMVLEEDDSTIDSQKQNKIVEIENTEHKPKINRDDDSKKNKETKSNEIRKDEKKKIEDKKSKSSSYRSSSKDDKHISRDDKQCSRDDKQSSRDDKHSSKDDKHRKSSSSKDKDKSSSRHSSSSKDRDTKDNAVKVKEKSKDSKDDSKNTKERESKGNKEIIEKDRHDRDKTKDKDKFSKNKEKEDEKSSKQKHDKEKKAKKEGDKEKLENEKNKMDKEKEKSSNDKTEKQKPEKEICGKDTIEKDRERSKDRSDKNKSHKERDKTKKSNEKSDKNDKKDRDRSKSSTSNNDKTVTSSSSSTTKESSSATNSKKREVEKDSKSANKHKKDKRSRDKSSDVSKDKKRDSKKDDHYSSKEKKNNRRSFDRDSSDGQSGKNSNAITSENRITNSQQNSNKDSSSNSFSGSGDSGNSDATERVSENQEQSFLDTEIQSTVEVPKMKYIKPKFALNFEEAKRIMKIRRQLAILERQNQLSLADLNIVQNGIAPPKPKKEINKAELKDVKISEDDDNDDETPKTSPFRGFDQGSEKTTSKNCVNETKERLTTSDLNLQSIFLSKENWEALEARLEQEMLKINFNAYESHYDDYDDGECTSITISPMKNTSVRNSCVIEEFKPRKLSEDENNKPVKVKDEPGVETEQVYEEIVEVDGVINMDVIEESDGKNKSEKIKNNLIVEKKQLSVRLNDMGIYNNFVLKTELEENKFDNESAIECDTCTHLEKCDESVLRNLEILHKVIGKLENNLEYSIKEYQNNILPENHTKVVKRGRKRKFDENVDLKNNNRLNYTKTTGIKKRGRPPKSTLKAAVEENPCNNTDILQDQNFSLPLSPAESETFLEKRTEYGVTPFKQRRVTTPRMQRYTSDDLYKPRPTVAGTKRSKREKNP